jgi:hypothetical protein
MRVIDLLVWSLGMVQRCWGYTYEQGGLRVRVGEERGGKEMDGGPLTDINFSNDVSSYYINC